MCNARDSVGEEWQQRRSTNAGSNTFCQTPFASPAARPQTGLTSKMNLQQAWGVRGKPFVQNLCPGTHTQPGWGILALALTREEEEEAFNQGS